MASVWIDSSEPQTLWSDTSRMNLKSWKIFSNQRELFHPNNEKKILQLFDYILETYILYFISIQILPEFLL